MDLALDTGVSPRHLSFVETGRAKASPELLLALAERLEVPLRDRNTLLLAAGYAPRYQQTPLSDDAMAHVRSALQRLLDTHHPFPGVVIDRKWNIVLSNAAAQTLIGHLPPELTRPTVNVFRACLHPAGFAEATTNFAEWGAYLVGQLRGLVAGAPDAELEALAAEVEMYPRVKDILGKQTQSAMSEWPTLLIPWRLTVGGVELSLFTTLTSFGTPQDITLAELAVELFYPADDATAAFFGG